MRLSPASHRLTLTALLVGSALGLTLPSVSAAQDRTWPPQYRRDRAQFALEGAGSLASLQGNALGSATDGTGFDVMASIGVSVLSLGGGYQRSTHSLASREAVVQGVFFEPRLALPLAARNFTPFVYGRVSRLERSIDQAVGRTVTNGTGLGAGVGTYVWIAPNVQLNTSVGWTDLRFGSGGDGVSVPLEGRTTGSSWGVRAGLTLGFDRWGR
jgi:hypothetical protein